MKVSAGHQTLVQAYDSSKEENIQKQQQLQITGGYELHS